MPSIYILSQNVQWFKKKPPPMNECLRRWVALGLVSERLSLAIHLLLVSIQIQFPKTAHQTGLEPTGRQIKTVLVKTIRHGCLLLLFIMDKSLVGKYCGCPDMNHSGGT